VAVPSACQNEDETIGTCRAATRGGGEVIEFECGYEDGQRRQCEAVTREKLDAKLEKVKLRLEADAPKMRRPGAALISRYLDPDRLPVSARWSRKHAHTLRNGAAAEAPGHRAVRPCYSQSSGRLPVSTRSPLVQARSNSAAGRLARNSARWRAVLGRRGQFRPSRRL